jgi:hypothetical protein
MKSWAYLDRAALQAVFPDVFADTGTQAGRARLRAMEQAWSGRGAAWGRFVLQVRTLRGAISGSSWTDLNLVAFVNYVLAAPDVETDLRLQGVSAIATVLKEAPPRRILVGAVPAVELRRGRYVRYVGGLSLATRQPSPSMPRPGVWLRRPRRLHRGSLS